jgi:3-phosphoshikimate 1-carboxyvinyltransferase
MSEKNRTVKLTPSSLTGEIRIPPSKSMSHRALICAGLASGKSSVTNLLFSQDILATIDTLEALGAKTRAGESEIEIEGIGGSPLSIPGGKASFMCRESGSTLRFMIPVAMAFSGSKVFEGKGRLVERPLTEFVKIFRSQKIDIDYSDRLPLATDGVLKAGRFAIEGKESSQYISGLLMAAPLLDGDSTVEIDGVLESKDYVDLTIDMEKRFGVDVEEKCDGSRTVYSVKGGQSFKPSDYYIEGDHSQAAFFLVAGQIGKELKCLGLDRNSRQADRRTLEIIESMGGTLEYGSDYVTSKPSRTKGTVIDASQCPDIIPVLCVLASLSEGETRVVNGKRLRIKESDRIKSTVSELSKLGAHIVETEDGMIIQGREMLDGGTVDSWNDHRIAMAMAIASIRCRGDVAITGAESVTKSYPHFFEDFAKIGGKVENQLG